MASKRILAPRLYQRFLQVCEQWPVDKGKVGRDLGEHIKERFGPSMKNTKIDQEQAEKMLDSLVKISSNYYREKYPRQKNTGFSTDVATEAQAIVSSTFQKEVREKRSIWEKIVGKNKRWNS